jgi:TolB protein
MIPCGRSLARWAVVASAATLLITMTSAVPAAAAFPGSNGKLVFLRSGDLYTMDPDGGNLIHLDTTGRRGRSRPSWSPDGGQIVFNRCCTADFDYIDLVDADGQNQTNVWDGDNVAWGADGNSLLYQGYNPSPDFDGRFSIWTVDLDTHDTMSLSHPTLQHGYDWWPAASPDGASIAFVRCCFKHPAQSQWNDIFIMAADGSGETRLTNNGVNDLSPDWAPDGSRIVFTRGRHVALMDPDGSHLVILRPGSNRRDSSPVFSPDGTEIAFVRCCFGAFRRTEIMTMDVDGGALTRLTHDDVQDLSPSWQPLP